MAEHNEKEEFFNDKAKEFSEKVKSAINKLPFNGIAQKVPPLAKFAFFANYAVCIFCILCLIILIPIVTSTKSGSEKGKLSANGVTVPEWMGNCHILYSESFWGNEQGCSIYQLFSTLPQDIKIKKITVKNKNVKIECASTDDSGNILIRLITEFVCTRQNNEGTSYISFVQYEVPLLSEKKRVDCTGPNDATNYGFCLGVLSEMLRDWYSTKMCKTNWKEEFIKEYKNGENKNLHHILLCKFFILHS